MRIIYFTFLLIQRILEQKKHVNIIKLKKSIADFFLFPFNFLTFVWKYKHVCAEMTSDGFFCGDKINIISTTSCLQCTPQKGQ